MIEKILIDYLNEVLEVPVYMEQPEEDVKRYVVLEKTRETVDDYIYSGMIAAQSYAETLLDACEINVEVIKAMDNAIVLPDISKSKLNSSYNYTDTTTKKYRYQAIYDLVYFL